MVPVDVPFITTTALKLLPLVYPFVFFKLIHVIFQNCVAGNTKQLHQTRGQTNDLPNNSLE